MTKEEFQSIVKSVSNKHYLILALGLKESGTSRRYINNIFKQYPDIDTSHFHIVRRKSCLVEKKCPKCQKTHTKNGKFCSRICANTRTHSEESKKKISNSVKNSETFKVAIEKLKFEGYYNKARNKVNIDNKESKRVSISCINCGNSILVTPFNANKRRFCNGTCRNKYNNKFICGNRSKAEVKLESEIKSKFPSLEVWFNNRTILNGLELDVYVPSIKFAIEWNGIFHYKEIKKGLLEKNRIKDLKKRSMCEELGINLIVIEDLTSHKKFIDTQIKNILGLLASGIADSLQKNCIKTKAFNSS